MQHIDLNKAKKPELKAALETALPQLESLRNAVSRLMRQSSTAPVVSHTSRPDDFVPAGWTEQYGIEIPRADGIFESSTAWVRVAHGVITGAGLKNQSILSMMISLRLLDEGAEHHGSLYVDWKAAFLSRLDPTKSGGEGDETPDAWSKEDRYSKLLHSLDQDYLLAVDSIVAPKPKAKHIAAFHSNQRKFADAFRVVGRAMNEINRMADDALEAARKTNKVGTVHT